MRKLGLSLMAAALVAATGASAQDEREVPYWASISSGEAMMRSGPGRTYPGQWLYQRRDLPVKIVQRYDNWRKIEDPDGTQGWMAVALLSERRTGMVTQGEPVEMRVGLSIESPVRFRLEAGVVGRLDTCDGTACLMRVGEAEGWVPQDRLWGVDAGEAFEQ
ncbi:SH3 domain-containing protein [Sphingomicrobium arenosum]|uniref:SH3 domain-containing protein n=1 Tax=Sphingomicrobium arenosum TaxID=2233861 RepID=UPI00223F266A|nr:SH3 domain-containing protein [Sphingomicrobium arenosum]